MSTLHGDPLIWGSGPQNFKTFPEPTYPFSVRAFGKMHAFLALVGEDRVSVKITLPPQPSHMFSGVVSRAISAASTLPQGRAAAPQAVCPNRKLSSLPITAAGQI